MSIPFLWQAQVISPLPCRAGESVCVRFSVRATQVPIALSHIEPLPLSHTFSPQELVPGEIFYWTGHYPTERPGKYFLGKGRWSGEIAGVPTTWEISGIEVVVYPNIQFHCLRVCPFSEDNPEWHKISLLVENCGNEPLQNLWLCLKDNGEVVGGLSQLRILELLPGSKKEWEIVVRTPKRLNLTVLDQNDEVLMEKSMEIVPDTLEKPQAKAPRPTLEWTLIGNDEEEVGIKNCAYLVEPDQRYFLTLHPKESPGSKRFPIHSIHFHGDQKILFLQHGHARDQHFTYEVQINFAPILATRILVPVEIIYEDRVVGPPQTLAFLVKGPTAMGALAAFSFGLPFFLEILLMSTLDRAGTFHRILCALAFLLMPLILLWFYNYLRGRQLPKIH